MSSFLHVQIAEGFAIPDWCGPLMYGSHVDERAALAESLQEFPTMANAVEMNPNKDFMLSQRSSFWRAKLPSMVRAQLPAQQQSARSPLPAAARWPASRRRRA
jgi:hypothetical protein